MRSIQTRLQEVSALFAVVVGLVLTSSCMADWPDNGTPTTVSGNCYAGSGRCCGWLSSCIGVGTHPDDYPDKWFQCGDAGATGTVWRSIQVVDYRQWGDCKGDASASCNQYAKFWCVEVSIYSQGNCVNGDRVCGYYSSCSNKCNPIETSPGGQ